jgi:hypothetical protein
MSAGRARKKNKKPDSDESGLAVVPGSVFQLRRIISAHDHRRQADPCQRARLIVVTATTDMAQFWATQFIAAMRCRPSPFHASRFFRRDAVVEARNRSWERLLSNETGWESPKASSPWRWIRYAGSVR